MKKIALAASLFLLFVNTYAQDKKVSFGLKLAPSLAWNRVIISNDPYNLDNQGIKPKMGVGVLVDYYFSENVGLGFGLNYAPKGSGYSYELSDKSKQEDIKMKLQYIELPITLKFYTNEIATDTKLYFQVGGSLNLNIQSKNNYKGFETISTSSVTVVQPISKDVVGSDNNIAFFELGALASTGVEMKLGTNTSFFVGTTYNRGLTNIARKTNLNGFKLLNDYFALDFGLKF